jgi:hypothetical protein
LRDPAAAALVVRLTRAVRSFLGVEITRSIGGGRIGRVDLLLLACVRNELGE